MIFDDTSNEDINLSDNKDLDKKDISYLEEEFKVLKEIEEERKKSIAEYKKEQEEKLQKYLEFKKVVDKVAKKKLTEKDFKSPEIQSLLKEFKSSTYTLFIKERFKERGRYNIHIRDSIERGKRGLNISLPIPFMPGLSKHIAGVQAGTYYLIGAQTGLGKTAFIDDCFILSPLEHLIKLKNKRKELEAKNIKPSEELVGITSIDFKVLYLSQEISLSQKLKKWACRKLLLDKGIYINTNILDSKGDMILPPEVDQYMLTDEFLDYMDEIEEHIIIYQTPKTGEEMEKMIKDFAKRRGTFAKRKVSTHKDLEDSLDEVYYPKQKELVIMVTDHLALIKKKNSKKEAMDDYSSRIVKLRNLLNYSFVVVQQFNREGQSTDRQKLSDTPQLNDFKESGNSQEDANLVLALYDPVRANKEQFEGFDMLRLKNIFRSLHILKNRDGEANKVIPMQFMGGVGFFRQLRNSKIFESQGGYEIVNSLESTYNTIIKPYMKEGKINW